MLNSIVVILVSIFVIKYECKVDLTHAEDVKTVFPEVLVLRTKRDVNQISDVEVKVVKLGDWSVELAPDDNLILTPELATYWFNSDDSLNQRRRTSKCDYRIGKIKGHESNSKVAMTLCEGSIRGYLRIRREVYFLEPLDEVAGEHVLYRSKRHNLNEPPSSSEPKQWVFNLTGDTIDIDTEDINDNFTIPEIEEMTILEPTTPKSTFTHSILNELHPKDINGFGEDDVGYFYDSAWTPNLVEIRKTTTSSVIPTRWLEIAVAVDHTLIAFHGRSRVEDYVLSLLNIVSAIYQDPSLDSNIKLVVTKLIMYEHKKFRHSVIKIGNAKKSLENVNAWNKALHASLSANEPKHDLAVWLTRSDIGGPSGYAPVGGVCDPKRSCALNRDEGLTSAFIIAHETAHILGLSHDGDAKNFNNCLDDALDGSIMAPMVSATFNKFYWSKCSKNEFKQYRNKWKCLLNPPMGFGEIQLNSTLQASFTMDQQCRMEFGDGYSMCRSFEIIEPCTHLWCGHQKTPLVCKTKKGPPLEGTECGFGKWCVNGYCEEFANRRVERVPIVLNPQDGNWGDWGPWGPCSRPCDIGVQFRTRKCDNPPPSFGGKPCEGKDEEWQLCKDKECVEPFIDLRAKQCKQLPKILNIQWSTDKNFTWLPYESDENAKKCKFICLNGNQKELFFTNENLIDGTPCSYDNEDNICVQGVCHVVGCDGILNSPLKRDKCGVCTGDNSECTQIKKALKRKLKKESSRFSILPENSRDILVELNVTKYNSDNAVSAFVLKNRRTKSYIGLSPVNVVHSKIFEGTKFYFKRENNRYKIWAKGPVRNEIILLIIVLQSEVQLGITVSYSSQFYIHKDNLLPSTKFVWILGGWGPCSASCDGGKRQKTVACYDIINKKVTKRTECALIQKPKLEVQKCNTFSCNFKWVPGEWEPCTTSCGTLGVQHREMYCIPNSVVEGNNGTVKQPWRYMVNPNHCGDNKPTTLKSCNREPCFSYWTFGNWTQCSASCGPGFQTRSSHCLPPEEETFFTCGEAPSPQRRSCFGPHTRFTNPLCRGRKRKACSKDESEYCTFDLLEKYCQIGGFKRMCCKTCEGFKLGEEQFVVAFSQ